MSMYGQLRTTVSCGAGRTKQSMKAECDINNIVARFTRTGLLEHLASGTPRYLNVSEVNDYRSAIEQVRKAEKFFAGLPAKVRAEFDNDAAAFVDYVTAPDRKVEDLKELGLVALGETVKPQDAPGSTGAPAPVPPPAGAGEGS